jgi:crotonobetainyl-CoA hydratase
MARNAERPVERALAVEPALMRQDGHVAVITLNRPEVRNAVDPAMATAVGDFLAAADADRATRAIVITGAGERAFCAGADLKATSSGEKPFSSTHPEWGFCGITQHVVRKPVIAAVNGHALGGGTEIALACDLVVASEHARFGLPEVTRGIVAGAGGLVRLQRQLPFKVAMRAVLTAEPLTAHDALRWGLVNEVVDEKVVVATAIGVAARVAANAPLAVQESKRVMLGVVDGARTDEALAWQLNAEALAVIRGSADAKEGIQAFIEKREPQWVGE